MTFLSFVVYIIINYNYTHFTGLEYLILRYNKDVEILVWHQVAKHRRKYSECYEIINFSMFIILFSIYITHFHGFIFVRVVRVVAWLKRFVKKKFILVHTG